MRGGGPCGRPRWGYDNGMKNGCGGLLFGISCGRPRWGLHNCRRCRTPGAGGHKGPFPASTTTPAPTVNEEAFPLDARKEGNE
jgi:hypothetical protein